MREIGDGVAKIEGLSDVMLNEMIEFPGGLYGLALTWKKPKSAASCSAISPTSRKAPKSRPPAACSAGARRQRPARPRGQCARPADRRQGPIKADVDYPVEKIAPGIIKRKSVSQPVQTGIMAIDAMIPIGRGQRELIIGDRATGKTTIAIDTIINQARINKAERGQAGFPPALLASTSRIGQKNSNVARTIAVLEEHGALHYTIIVSRAGFRHRHQPIPRAVRRRGDGRVVHG